MAGIDLDEVVVAAKAASSADGEAHGVSELADFRLGEHWAIFAGLGLTFGLVGITAAYRNVKNTLPVKNKLKALIKGVQKDIKRAEDYKKKSSGDRVQDYDTLIIRLKAFEKSLKYSKFDANFNLVFPGVVNGAASSLLLSTVILESTICIACDECLRLRTGWPKWY